MSQFSKARFNKYETQMWPAYEKIMEVDGFTLRKKIDVGEEYTSYDNLTMGDGIWYNKSKNEISNRDLKICGKKFDCPVSKKSIQSFSEIGFYDFYDPYFEHKVYHISAKYIHELYNQGLYYNDTKDFDLIRFKYKLIMEANGK